MKREAWLDADAWFQWVWDELAETMPDNNQVQVVSADFKEALHYFHDFDVMGIGVNECVAGCGAASSSTQSTVDVRHLGPGSLRMLFDLYAAGAGPSSQVATLSTWRRVYTQKWSRTLMFRREGVHTQCNLCGP